MLIIEVYHGRSMDLLAYFLKSPMEITEFRENIELLEAFLHIC